MGIKAWLRGLSFAWMRFAAACLIVALPISTLFSAESIVRSGQIWSGLAGIILLSLFGSLILLIGTPLVLAYRVIAKKEAPYMMWGYVLVVLYGPALVYFGTEDRSLNYRTWLIYEPVALAVFATYIWVWKMADRFADNWLRGPVKAEDRVATGPPDVSI